MTAHQLNVNCRHYLPNIQKWRNRRLRNGIVTACPECKALWVSRKKVTGYGEHVFTDHYWEEIDA